MAHITMGPSESVDADARYWSNFVCWRDLSSSLARSSRLVRQLVCEREQRGKSARVQEDQGFIR